MNTRFLDLPRFHKQLVAASFDFACLPLLLYFSLILHFDGIPAGMFSDYAMLALGASLTGLPVFVRLGMYRAVIRYIRSEIAIAAVNCATLAALLLAAIHMVSDPHPLSVTPFLIFWASSILYILASRFAARRWLHSRGHLNDKVRVAIYGAGEAGSLLARAIMPGNEYEAVLFVDDNPQRVNTTIGGIRVYPASALEHLAKKFQISTVLLAMPSLTRPQQRTLLDSLARLSLIIKVTPPVSSIVTGKAKVQDVRQIQIEDLLSRDVVAPDEALLSYCVTGKAILVSGAGGSIGSELCRQIIHLQPLRLLLVDSSEYALYAIEQELREIMARHQLDIELVACLGSVLEKEKCTRLMTTFGVDTVYHAAAYKHVPLVEHNPIEGIRNNAFGTLSLAEAAAAARVKYFVLISTDKAVRPTNMMGATKRLAELILQAFARRGSATRFCMVRFGNVLGSSGSVVPLFRKQIAAGGPLTLTHPDITRYFMTIPEAAQLVIQAGAMGKGGDVFVLDMGKPVRIADLAERMVHLSGQVVRTEATPTGTIEIRYVGLRPGEKLYEELLIGSNVTHTEHPLIQRAREAELEWPLLNQMLQQLDDACHRFDHSAIRLLMQKLVREYAPSSDIVDHVWSQGDQFGPRGDADRELPPGTVLPLMHVPALSKMTA
ncbi:MAG TPA: nucleoside-diphosphate sugar epimerase/dehydratase [Telluria sp.]|jgi:FlaA1/EpsC-like NDP-sugar epimerase